MRPIGTSRDAFLWCDWANWCHFQMLTTQWRKDLCLSGFWPWLCPCCPCYLGAGSCPQARELTFHLTVDSSRRKTSKFRGILAGELLTPSSPLWKVGVYPCLVKIQYPQTERCPLSSHICLTVCAFLCWLLQWFKPAQCFPSLDYFIWPIVFLRAKRASPTLSVWPGTLLAT